MPFVQRPLEPRAHDLGEDAVEIVRDVRGEKRAIAPREAPSRLEEIGHVQRAPGAVPIEIADRVKAHGVEQRRARLAVRSSYDAAAGPCSISGSWIASPASALQLGDRRVLQRVVKPPGIDPCAPLLGVDAHRVRPLDQQCRHAHDVRATLLGDLRPRRQLDSRALTSLMVYDRPCRAQFRQLALPEIAVR